MRRFYSLFTAVILTVTPIFAKVSLLSPKRSEYTATLNFKIDKVKIDTVTVGGKSYSSVTINDINTALLEKGHPALPFTTVDIALNGAESVDLKIDAVKYKTIKVLPPVPSKGNFTRNLNPSKVKLTKSDIYDKNCWYPAKSISSAKPFQLRKQSGVAIQINPVQYNGARGEVRIAEEITFSVIEKGNSIARSHKREQSKVFKDIYSRRFINYRETSSRYTSVMDGESMIIITPDKYKDALESFVAWKNQKGIKTTLHIYPTETGADTNQIRDFIQGKYESDDISYVTLVGDAEDIPAYMVSVDDKENYGDHLDSIVPADPLYGMIVGNDLYPDLFIGRIPVENSYEVATIVNKTIKYEKTPDPQGTWYQKAVGIGSNEGSPMDADWVADSIHSRLSDYGYTTLNEIFQGDGKTASDLSDYINDGRGLVNFMGHGNFDGFGFNGPFWYGQSYSSALTNGDKLPVVIPLACNFGQYLGRDGAAESWIKNPDGGAVAIVGSTPLMDWTPPQWAQVEMNKLITEEAHESFGAYFYNGEMKMLDNSVYQGEKTVKTWVYFGDPSLQLFTKTPQTMDFSYTRATGTLSVSGEDGALVTLCNAANDIIDSKRVSSGRVDFTFTANEGDVVTLTATKRNRVPYIETIVVGDGTPIESVVSTSLFSIESLTTKSLKLTVPSKGNYTVELLSVNGRSLNKKEYSLTKGTHSLNITTNTIPSGMLIVKVNGEAESFIRKLIVRK